MTDFSKKTEDELKIMAYDLLVAIELAKQNLRGVNLELAKRVPTKPVEAGKEE